MEEIESMVMTIEGEWGSSLTTIEEMVDGGLMPDSYYVLSDMLKTVHAQP